LEEEVILTKEGAIAYLTINREKTLNALNQNIMMRLNQIFEDLEKEDEILVVVITGAGKKSFVAGADIVEIKNAGKNRTEMIMRNREIFSKIRNSSKIVIAAVNGYALGGGCELAMACDIRISSENAKFGLPETKLGLMPGYGGTQLLPRMVGLGRAKYIILSGEPITAKEAYEFGLVEKVVKEETLMDEVKRLAQRIVQNGPLAIKSCKRAINKGIELSIDEALRLELSEYDKVSKSEDAQEGIISFLEKRRPSFKGK
jgi:enoyl-CoA hydratase